MSSAERVQSLTNDPNLVWTGPNTSRWAGRFLSRPIDLVVNTPADSAGTYVTRVSNAGVPLDSALTNTVMAVNDGVAPDTRDGCMRLSAPSPAVSGSSLSHFSDSALPEVLMKPSVRLYLPQVGLALNVLQDIGWPSRAEDGLFVDGFDGSPCAHVQP